jgi:hypothetical protein
MGMRQHRSATIANACTVTLPRPARLALSEMTWYVTPRPVPWPVRRRRTGSGNVMARNGTLTGVHSSTGKRPSWVLYVHPRMCCYRQRATVSGRHKANRQPERLTILGRRLLPSDPLPDRLSLQAPESQLHHPHLPPQHQLKRQHLLGYSARPVEPRSDHLEG